MLTQFGAETKDQSLKYAKTMKDEAENQLMKTKQEAEAREKEIDKTCEENIKKLEQMSVDGKNEMVSQNQIIQILQAGLDHLAELQKQWSGITMFFGTIKNQLREKTTKKIEDFVDACNVVQEDSTTYDDVMPDYITAALVSSSEAHYFAKMYVKISNNCIMENLNQMHRMLALPSNAVQEMQNKIKASCTEASNGIKEMYREEMENKVLQITEQQANM